MGNREGEANGYGYLGTVFQSLNEYINAKEYHEKVLAISMVISHRALEKAQYGNLGNVFTVLVNTLRLKNFARKNLR